MTPEETERVLLREHIRDLQIEVEHLKRIAAWFLKPGLKDRGPCGPGDVSATPNCSAEYRCGHHSDSEKYRWEMDRRMRADAKKLLGER